MSECRIQLVPLTNLQNKNIIKEVFKIMSSQNKLYSQAKKIGNSPFFVIISGACSIISLPLAFLSNNPVLNGLIVLVCVGLLLVLIFRGTSFSRVKKKIDKFYDLLEIIERQNTEYKKCADSIQNGELSEYSYLDAALKPYIDCMTKLSEIILEKKGCICVKMIETQSLMDIDIKKWKIRTIARSQSTRSNRTKNDKMPVYVSENSDFYDIITGVSSKDEVRLDPFLVPDLQKLIKAWKISGRVYKNSTKDYLKRYKSTMVFPIATERENVSKIISASINNSSAYYHVIGFLCWDSKEVFEEDDEDFSSVAELLSSFADILYPLLESYMVKQLQQHSQQAKV